MNDDSNSNDREAASTIAEGYYAADAFTFYLNAIVGTMGGACLFGGLLGGFEFGLEGGVLGAFIGPLIAIFVGAVVFANIAIVAWSFWLFPYYYACAAVGGAITGLLCTIGLMYEFDFFVVRLLFASILGGAGASLAVNRFVQNTEAGRRFAITSRSLGCTFTLGEMFAHFTVLALQIALWAWLYKLTTTVQ